ncbi:MAG TPA: hypothetical protein DCP92_10285 [Nitrospiraceae bacterium]|jgi:DUF438 domain-containing protein|nr:hypothetical protein [Nitrospiraceae bacterium]
MAIELSSDAEWVKVRRGEAEIGYAWIEPEKAWLPEVAVAPLEGRTLGEGELSLNTGQLTLEQVKI